METPEEFVGSNDQIHMAVKGRRTKRQRVNSSATCGGGGGAASSTSSSCGVGEEDFASSSSQTVISGEIIDHQEISTEEEQDMANCLILLAQGGGRPRPTQIIEDSGKIERISSRRFGETMAVTTTQGKVAAAGFYVYECKTCNRTFPSFQALGGHRASHKKPKPTVISAVDEKIKKLPGVVMARDESEESQFNKILPVVQMTNRPANLQGNKAKIHECSICGLEFTSGQALGGHMRRHRTVSATQVAAMNMDSASSAMETEIKQRNILQLDLNLPAPEEDLRDTKFQFTPTPQTIVFSAPTLVDCHY